MDRLLTIFSLYAFIFALLEIDFEEFISLMRLRMDERQRDPEADLRDAFDMFDADRS